MKRYLQLVVVLLLPMFVSAKSVDTSNIGYGGTYNEALNNEGNLVIDGATFTGNSIINSISGTVTIKDYNYNGTTSEYIIWDGGTLDLTNATNTNLTPTNKFGIKINKDGLNIENIKCYCYNICITCSFTEGAYAVCSTFPPG